jgi:hypothetical protein
MGLIALPLAPDLQPLLRRDRKGELLELASRLERRASGEEE